MSVQTLDKIYRILNSPDFRDYFYDWAMDFLFTDHVRQSMDLKPLDPNTSFYGLSWAEMAELSQTYVLFSNDYIDAVSSDTFDFDWNDLIFTHQQEISNRLADALEILSEHFGKATFDKMLVFSHHGILLIFTKPIEINELLIKLKTNHNILKVPDFSLHDEIYDWYDT